MKESLGSLERSGRRYEIREIEGGKIEGELYAPNGVAIALKITAGSAEGVVEAMVGYLKWLASLPT